MKPPRIVPFAEAYVLAKHASQVLAPHVVRMKAVGSIRRRREFVGDLEFLVEPRMSAIDLFGKLAPELEALKGALLCLGTWVKGADRQMVITDFNGRKGLKLELYIVHPPASWGTLLAIRTGPLEVSREAVTKLREKGLRSEGGRVLNQKNEEESRRRPRRTSSRWPACHVSRHLLAISSAGSSRSHANEPLQPGGGRGERRDDHDGASSRARDPRGVSGQGRTRGRKGVCSDPDRGRGRR